MSYIEVNYEGGPPWIVKGLTIKDKLGYDNEPMPFEVKPGDELHILYVVYSTGDSFSHQDDGSFKVIGIYKNIDLAKENLKRIKQHNNAKNDSFPSWDARHQVELLTETDKTISFYASWKGYFESLSYIKIETFHVNHNDSDTFYNAKEH